MNLLRNGNYIIGIVLALFLLGIVLDRLGYMTQPRLFIQTLISPAQGLASAAAAQTSDLTSRQQNVAQLQEEKTFLQNEVNRLLVENIQLRELERENQQLRDLLNYTQNNRSFDYATASVIGRVIGADSSNLLYTIFIDVGAKEGVARDMPVVTERGLIGRVTQVTPGSAQVLLIIDPASSVNAVIQNTRVEGIVRGELGGTLIMERIPQGEEVSPGDLVLTSGLGGNFPDKLVIGQVTEILQEDLELFQSARVRSTVDFGDFEKVLVLTAFRPIELQQDLPGFQEVDN